MRFRLIATMASAMAAALVLGCASSSTVVPAAFRDRVDENLSFVELRNAPESYRGRTVLLGGEVLSARRERDATRIEILQLPLDEREAPIFDRTESDGRFLVYQREFMDPATLPAGTRVTIIGEVTGSKTDRLDEAEYRYPTLDLKHITTWPERRRLQRSPYFYDPYPTPFWGWRRWGPWGPYPYGPYWW